MRLANYVLEASEQQFKAAIASHPIFAVLQQGRLTKGQYLSYLRETYHLVRHTTSFLARAASYLPDEHRSLRGWFLEQAVDEHNHDLLCVTDVEALGEDAKIFLSEHPKAGAWGLITQCYYLAEHDPVAILGFFLTTEGIGAAYGATYADVLTGKYGYASNQVTFLRAHGGFDVKHMEEVQKFLNSLPENAATRDSVLSARRFTISYYAQMLQDAVDSPASVGSEVVVERSDQWDRPKALAA